MSGDGVAVLFLRSPHPWYFYLIALSLSAVLPTLSFSHISERSLNCSGTFEFIINKLSLDGVLAVTSPTLLKRGFYT